MVDFNLTETQTMIRDMARNFAVKEVEPFAAEWDEKVHFPSDAVKKMGELGLLGIAVPEALGGAGMDHVSYVLAMEEISRACASTGVIMSVNNSLVCDPLWRYASEAQVERWLKPLASGQKLGCFALSEPGNGSDAAAAATTAVRDGDGWILNGTKNWITNAPDSDFTIVFAQTDKDAGSRGITAFGIDMPHPGLSLGPNEKKLGIKASSCSQVIMEDCRVDDSNVLGKVGEGFKIAMSTLDGGRIGIASQALGIARAGFEAAARYTTERKAFGKYLHEFQGVSFKLADMATKLDAARLLTLRAAALKDQSIEAAKKGQKIRYTKEAAMAKLFASEAAMWITTQAVQVFGGYGYLKDFPVERHFRDAKITEIYEGTSEIHRLVIATSVLKEISA